MRLEGYRSPSCPAAEERAFFISAGRDAIFNFRSLRLPVSQFIYPPYKVSPRVTEDWLNDTEMLTEASKMRPAAG